MTNKNNQERVTEIIEPEVKVEETKQVQQKVKDSSLKDAYKILLAYYTLSTLFLFIKIFEYKVANSNVLTYKLGFIEFANGIGWIYYIATAIGFVTVLFKPLRSLETLAAKIISLVNLVVSIILLFKIIPDAINPMESIVGYFGKSQLGLGFWLILGLHLIASTALWFKFFKSMIDKSKARKAKKEAKAAKKDLQ